jgi:class 3 adenylate cyclase
MVPEDIIEFLNTYFDAMVRIVFSHRGILDKFIGDELMATFGVVGDTKDGPMNALNAAVAMQIKAQELISEFRVKNYPEFEIGIGINTGDVVMGSVGSSNRMDYTVIGDTVNVASRLQHITEGQCILVGENTYQRCKAHIPMLPMGEVKIRNRASPVKYYQVKS